MAENASAIVRAGIDAFKRGDKDEARALLLKATEIEPHNEDAWLWLSGLLTDPEEQRVALENVLIINPANDRARKGLDHLNSKSNPAPPTPEPPAPPPAAPPPAPPVQSRPPATLATSVEWASDEPSAPVARAFTNDPADVDYDKWVSELPIQAPTKGALPFMADDVTFDDDDALNAGPFGASAIFSGDDDDSQPAYTPSTTTTSAVTYDAQFDETSLPAEANAAIAVAAAALAQPPTPAQKQPSPFDGIELDVGDFGKEDAEPSKPSERDARKARRDADKAAKAAAKAERTAAKKAALDVPHDMSELEPDARAVVEALQDIPREIAPTRLPTSIERQPLLLQLVFFVLVLLNLGAAALLINRILVPLS